MPRATGRSAGCLDESRARRWASDRTKWTEWLKTRHAPQPLPGDEPKPNDDQSPSVLWG